MHKKCLVTRIGALGDSIIITPVLKRLKELGYYVIMHTGWRGKKVLLHDPSIDEFIEHDESVKIDDFNKCVKGVVDKVKPDKHINFTESLEVNIALHPMGPMYTYPKKQRQQKCDKNYYDETIKWANMGDCQRTPILYFTKEEKTEAKSHVSKDKFTILWQLSGSGRQKVYPWTDYVMGEVLKNHPNVEFITTGDEKCQIIETLEHERIKNLSGKIDVRVAMCLTNYTNLVISPDTGLLHASGCYDTPKIGLLGHTTINNITKYFENDYSLEAECDCAPCFHLIYDHEVQCPIDPVTHASWCMARGLSPERVNRRIEDVIRQT